MACFLGLNVTGNLYRHPGLLAKIAVTVDHLSNGRLEFGIGTGWNEPEFTQFALPFPSAGDRVTMLDESLKAMKLLWSEPRSTYKGRFYELKDAIAEPKPVQRPHPPIWIGSKCRSITCELPMRAIPARADAHTCSVPLPMAQRTW